MRSQYAVEFSRAAGFMHEVVSAGPFKITTFRKLANITDNLLVIYLEGDGQAFLRSGKQSTNPTPKTPVALQLAVQDPHPSVLYIARPCQYLEAEKLKNCDPKYWSTARYSEIVIAAVNEVIDKAKKDHQQIVLIGYSGGGAIAALIAARRNDVQLLVTIAANLDHAYWTHYHSVTPLTDSLNAADYATKIANMPQLHLVGKNDRIVPVSVIESFLSRIPDSQARLQIIPGYDHQCCWARDWPQILYDSVYEDTSSR